MGWEITTFLIVFGLAIFLKLINYKFDFHKIKKQGINIIKDLSIIIGEYVGFITGFSITKCFLQNDVVCGISELNIIVIGMGILMMGTGFIGYCYSITKDFKKNKSNGRKTNKSKPSIIS